MQINTENLTIAGAASGLLAVIGRVFWKLSTMHSDITQLKIDRDEHAKSIDDLTQGYGDLRSSDARITERITDFLVRMETQRKEDRHDRKEYEKRVMANLNGFLDMQKSDKELYARHAHITSEMQKSNAQLQEALVTLAANLKK